VQWTLRTDGTSAEPNPPSEWKRWRPDEHLRSGEAPLRLLVRRVRDVSRHTWRRENVLDLMFVGIVLVFFGLSFGYTAFCDRL
jgi:hypothetical protein